MGGESGLSLNNNALTTTNDTLANSNTTNTTNTNNNANTALNTLNEKPRVLGNLTNQSMLDHSEKELSTSNLTPRSLNRLPLSKTGTLIENPFDLPSFKPRSAWSLEAGLDISSFNYTVSGSNAANDDFINNSYSQTIGRGGFLRVNYQPLNFLSVNSGVEIVNSLATQDYSTFSFTTTVSYDTIGFYFDSVSQMQLPILDTNSMITPEEQLNSLTNSTTQVTIPLGVMFHVPLGTRSQLGVNVTGLIGIRTKSTGSILVDPNGASIDAINAL